MLQPSGLFPCHDPGLSLSAAGRFQPGNAADVGESTPAAGGVDAQLLGRGYTWMDAGTFDSLQKATDFVSMIEQYQGLIISSPEEIAYHMGWIDDNMLAASVKRYGKSPYGERLKAVLEGKVVL